MGTVAGLSLFIGNEDGNNWCGWFDSAENLLSSGAETASGIWLEGLIDLEQHLGTPLPDGVYLCAAAGGQTTTIRLFLPHTAPVSLEIYNVACRRVRTLVSGTLGPGRHTISWDGINSAGSEVSQGIYFLRLISGEHHLTGKVVILK